MHLFKKSRVIKSPTATKDRGSTIDGPLSPPPSSTHGKHRCFQSALARFLAEGSVNDKKHPQPHKKEKKKHHQQKSKEEGEEERDPRMKLLTHCLGIGLQMQESQNRPPPPTGPSHGKKQATKPHKRPLGADQNGVQNSHAPQKKETMINLLRRYANSNEDFPLADRDVARNCVCAISWMSEDVECAEIMASSQAVLKMVFALTASSRCSAAEQIKTLFAITNLLQKRVEREASGTTSPMSPSSAVQKTSTNSAVLVGADSVRVKEKWLRPLLKMLTDEMASHEICMTPRTPSKSPRLTAFLSQSGMTDIPARNSGAGKSSVGNEVATDISLSAPVGLLSSKNASASPAQDDVSSFQYMASNSSNSVGIRRTPHALVQSYSQITHASDLSSTNAALKAVGASFVFSEKQRLTFAKEIKKDKDKDNGDDNHHNHNAHHSSNGHNAHHSKESGNSNNSKEKDKKKGKSSEDDEDPNESDSEDKENDDDRSNDRDNNNDPSSAPNRNHAGINADEAEKRQTEEDEKGKSNRDKKKVKIKKLALSKVNANNKDKQASNNHNRNKRYRQTMPRLRRRHSTFTVGAPTNDVSDLAMICLSNDLPFSMSNRMVKACLIKEILLMFSLLAQWRKGTLTFKGELEKQVINACLKAINTERFLPSAVCCLGALCRNVNSRKYLFESDALDGVLEAAVGQCLTTDISDTASESRHSSLLFTLHLLLCFTQHEDAERYMQRMRQGGLLNALYKVCKGPETDPLTECSVQILGKFLCTEQHKLEIIHSGCLSPLITSAGRQKVTLYKEVNFESFDLSHKTLIASGGDGNVFKCEWEGKTVAVKLLKTQDLTAEDMKYFLREVSIMSVLSHPNLVTVIGACSEPPHYGYITPHFEEGNLVDLLEREQESIAAKGEEGRIPTQTKIKLARDIASAMSYLHSLDIIHRDLKPANLLVKKDENGELSLCCCDFGLARVMATEMTNAALGTPAFIAPEVYEHRGHSRKTDVYSFGFILWQMITGKEPFSELGSPWALTAAVTRGERPPLPDDVHEGVREVIARSWHQDPDKRPTFDEIIHMLDSVWV